MITVDQYSYIRTANRVYGKKIREIARDTGHSKNTVFLSSTDLSQIPSLAGMAIFGQVGLESSQTLTHWVIIINFIPSYREFQDLGFILARAWHCSVFHLSLEVL